MAGPSSPLRLKFTVRFLAMLAASDSLVPDSIRFLNADSLTAFSTVVFTSPMKSRSFLVAALPLA